MAKIDEKPATTEVAKDSNLESIINRLDALEKENQELKDKEKNAFVKGKEMYDGPRHYSYKMWGGIPVLSYVSIRKDPSKDLLYKNSAGEYISNHFLKLSLANGKTVEVEVNDFNRSFTRSEKQPAEVRTTNDKDGNQTTVYVFDHPERDEIEVLYNMIN